MASARELLAGGDFTLCLTVDGVTYTDNRPIGGTVKNRIIGGLTYEESANGEQIGVIELADVNTAPLGYDLILAAADAGADYDLSVCGVYHKHMFDEEIVDFNNRKLLFSGQLRSIQKQTMTQLVALEIDNHKLDEYILEPLEDDDNTLNAQDIVFTRTNDTLAAFDGVVNVDVQTDAVNVDAQTIEINLTESVDQLDIGLSSNHVGDSHTVSNWYNYSGNVFTGVSGDVTLTLELSDLTANPTATLTSSHALNELALTMYDVETSGGIDNYSVEPDSVEPPFGDGVNSVVKWTGLGGIKQLTFDLHLLYAITLDVLNGRPRISGADVIILQSVVLKTGLPLPPISWNVTPTEAPEGDVGAYTFNDVSGLVLTTTFTDTDTDNLVLSVDENAVTIENETDSLTITIAKITRTHELGQADKVRPFLAGRNVLNYQPVKPKVLDGGFSSTSYDGGSNLGDIKELRDKGVVVTKSASFAAFVTDAAAGLKRWYFELSENIETGLFSGSIKLSGDYEQITIDGDGYIAGQTEVGTLGQTVETLCGLVGQEFGAVDANLRDRKVSLLFDKQLTLRQATNALVQPLDAYIRLDQGKLFVEMWGDNVAEYDHTINEQSYVYDTLKIGAAVPKNHLVSVGYAKNNTRQDGDDIVGWSHDYQRAIRNDDAIKYKTEYKAVPGSVPPMIAEVTVRTNSTELEVLTPFDSSVDADWFAVRLLAMGALKRFPVAFSDAKNLWKIRRNEKLKLEFEGLPAGTFLVEPVREDTQLRQTQLSGVCFVSEAE